MFLWKGILQGGWEGVSVRLRYGVPIGLEADSFMPDLQARLISYVILAVITFLAGVGSWRWIVEVVLFFRVELSSARRGKGG